MSSDAIRKHGYRAAVQGETLWACPFYRAAEMPSHTGEAIGSWWDKVYAWEQGWRLANRKLERNRRVPL